MYPRYYEFEVLLPGPMKVGWTKISMEPGQELGADGKAFMFDGHMVKLDLRIFTQAVVGMCLFNLIS